MMFNNYKKQNDIIIIPKNKNIIKISNQVDIKPKSNSSYDNIKKIILEKKDIKIENPKNNNI